ncbi:MAG: mucoidy inhibitor MuiA family protein [Crocinitomix sp.]|nr:mucoidy inhibitor MuiA family protein [Crocinitomix sp.]
MKYILLSLLFSANFISFAQEIKTSKISSDIEAVTVFLTGGEVHRKASVNLKKGRNKLIFTQISTVADNKSIQFSSETALNLVSVSSEIDYLSVTESNPRIRAIKDSIQLLNDEVVDLQNEKSAYQVERQLLEQNKSIKGDSQNLTVEELSAMAVYYRKHIMEINKTMTSYDLRIRKKNNLKYRYQNQLTELNYKETIKSNQIVVIVDAESAHTAAIDLKYMVSNCGWQANYDLRADNIKDKISLKYKAKVYNNTGNDWADVNLSLSTSDPNLSASAPELSPWYLNYSSLMNQTDDSFKGNEYVVPSNRAYTKYYQNWNSAPQINQNLDGLYATDTFNYEQSQSSAANPEDNIKFTNIEVSQLSTTFEIEKKYYIPSDAKPYLVDITEHSLDATFSHKAVPKLDKDAFLLANIVGWESLDLVPGPTQVYFSEAFVGQSYINTSNVADTLRLSFGRDTKIPVSRKLVQEFSDKKVIGSNRKDNYTYKIIAKNNRDIPVRLSLYDQIPISQDSDISITINETSAATYNETTGKLTWLLNLKPGESKSYQISFTIKYPKNKTIRVKKYRTISAPSF